MLENCDLVSQLKIEMIYFVTVTSFRSQECQSRCSEDFSIPVEEDFKLEFCFLARNEGSGEEKQRRWQEWSSRFVFNSLDWLSLSLPHYSSSISYHTYSHQLSLVLISFSWLASVTLSVSQLLCPQRTICLPRWHYDSSNGVCKQFTYKGKKGNGNRFLTRQVRMLRKLFWDYDVKIKLGGRK